MVYALPGLYTLSCVSVGVHSRVEAGSNTSTVALRVVGGDESEVSNLRQ
jgi:hypothetical protein